MSNVFEFLKSDGLITVWRELKRVLKSLVQYQSVQKSHQIVWKAYKIAHTRIFIPVILFLVMKMVKKSYDGNESLDLA